MNHDFSITQRAGIAATRFRIGNHLKDEITQAALSIPFFKSLPELRDFSSQGPTFEDHLADIIGQFIKMLGPHSESCHLLNPHSQAPRRGKSLIIGCALVLDGNSIPFHQIPSQSTPVSSGGNGMMKTGFRVRCNTALDTLPRKVCAKNPFPWLPRTITSQPSASAAFRICSGG